MKKYFFVLVLAVIFAFTGMVSDAGVSPGLLTELETISVLLPGDTTSKVDLPSLPKARENYIDSLDVLATAYGPPLFLEGEPTASGEPAGPYKIATDWSVIPLYSRVQLFDKEGVLLFNGKIFVVFDSGRLITGKKIDLFFGTLEQQQKWGIKEVEVRILKGLEKRRRF